MGRTSAPVGSSSASISAAASGISAPASASSSVESSVGGASPDAVTLSEPLLVIDDVDDDNESVE